MDASATLQLLDRTIAELGAQAQLVAAHLGKHSAEVGQIRLQRAKLEAERDAICAAFATPDKRLAA